MVRLHLEGLLNPTVERLNHNQKVVGSIPTSAIDGMTELERSEIANLVTAKASWVQIPLPSLLFENLVFMQV